MTNIFIKDEVESEINRISAISEVPNDCVSLYDICKAINKGNRKYYQLLEHYNNELARPTGDRSIDSSTIEIQYFNYKYDGLVISFMASYDEYPKYIDLFKKNGELFIEHSETPWGIDVLKVLGNKLSKIYDEFKAIDSPNDEVIYNIKSSNSKFYISISNYGIDVSLFKGYCSEDEKFEIKVHRNEYKCDNYDIMENYDYNYDELFKKILVKKTDCPKWIRKELKKPITDDEYQINKDKPKTLSLTNKITDYIKSKF